MEGILKEQIRSGSSHMKLIFFLDFIGYCDGVKFTLISAIIWKLTAAIIKIMAIMSILQC